ncbi:hypothetical protein L3Q82_021741 [Scortum barcoo]|uniref:Uncharacterized protein n=1 Tax=Scortum barcoo TaxID=214431 RepID=A0ACB8X5C7_9TELE|nr:hypothetical protein L3Q82_021741 [Scortum barcoo]
MDDIDAMFSNLLGEMDHLSQATTAQLHQYLLTESLNELEDHDLDALVADLGSNSTKQTSGGADNQTIAPAMTQESEPAAALPLPSNAAESSGDLQMSKPQTKAEKIKLALEKLKEAKVRKLIVKVLMSDGGSKTLMLDERQTVREVLDELFEKTHCDCSIDWSLCETNPELQIERGFEDHEHLVEPLSVWTRHSENKIFFVARPQKYVMFRDPQLFYMWKKKEQAGLSGINQQAKQLLLKGLGRRGPLPRLLPKPHCTGPSWTFLRVVSLLEGGPTSPFRAEPIGRVPWAKTRPPGARLRAPTPGLAPGWGPGPVCHGRPYQGRNAPDNIAPRIIRAHKPLHHSKVAVQGGEYQEHFGGSTVIVPDIEGTLYLKEDGRKVWKPRYFVLRASGIYYVPKGKTKSSTDLVCFVRFEKVNVYSTNSYKQKYKAPTNFCFVLKHPCIQKESHYIKFLCCEDEHTLLLWINSIRIAKYGSVLYKNYQVAVKASSLQTLHSGAPKGRSACLANPKVTLKTIHMSHRQTSSLLLLLDTQKSEMHHPPPVYPGELQPVWI